MSNATKNANNRINLEASHISLWKSDFNKQKDFERQALSRNVFTYSPLNDVYCLIKVLNSFRNLLVLIFGDIMPLSFGPIYLYTIMGEFYS